MGCPSAVVFLFCKFALAILKFQSCNPGFDGPTACTICAGKDVILPGFVFPGG